MSSVSLSLASPTLPRHHAQPCWRPASVLPAGTPGPELRTWLLSTGLLTSRAERTAMGDFSLRVVDERFEIRPTEAGVLGVVSPRVWVREIELMSGPDVLVYAHTVVP